MYKTDVLAKFPKEVVVMANKGLYILFVSNDEKTLVAKDDENVFMFSSVSGEFIKSKKPSEFNSSLYQRIHLVTPEQVQNLLKTAN